MKHIESLAVKYHQEKVGTLSLSADGKVCTFEYDNQWLASGFSISPLELPLKPGLFIAKATPFNGNFGIFEDSLPDGYGRYLLHKALLKEGINDFELSALDRLSIVGNGGMGALTYEPTTSIQTGHEIEDFDLLQTKALEVLKEQQDNDAGLLLYNMVIVAVVARKPFLQTRMVIGWSSFAIPTTHKIWESKSIIIMR